MKFAFLILLIVCCFSSFNLFGQSKNPLSYQLNVAANITIPAKRTIEIWPEIEGHPVSEYSQSTGGFIELSINYAINEEISFNPGIYLSDNLISESYTSLIENRVSNIRLTYTGISALLEYKPDKDKKLSIGIGPYVSYLILANEKGVVTIDSSQLLLQTYPDPEISLKEDYEKKLTNNYKNYDVGLSLNIDYSALEKDKFTAFLFARFNYGLLDIQKFESENRWNNYTVQIGFGVRL